MHLKISMSHGPEKAGADLFYYTIAFFNQFVWVERASHPSYHLHLKPVCLHLFMSSWTFAFIQSKGYPFYPGIP